MYGTNDKCDAFGADSNWTDTACITFRGGKYDQLASTSRGAIAANLLSVDGEGSGPPCSYVTDNITLNANVTLGSFPLGVALADWGEQGYYPQDAIGLGLNSSILHALKTSGQIASRTWSMFWGRTGGTIQTQLDGGFVFGGYDRAKVSGRNYTQALSTIRPGCASNMLVTISDLILNFPNGTETSLFQGAQQAALTACISPDYPTLLGIPYDPYFTTFESLTNADGLAEGPAGQYRSFGLYYYGMLYDDIEPLVLAYSLFSRLCSNNILIPSTVTGAT